MADGSIYLWWGLVILFCDVYFVTAECPDGKFGTDCKYDCHCQTSCNKTTGSCPTGNCTEGYDGPSCQKVNKALGQLTNSTNSSNNLWTSEKAVDGDTNQDLNKNSCFYSAASIPPTIWRVFLNEIIPMDNIVIYHRINTYFLNNSQVLIANVTRAEILCKTFTDQDTQSSNIFSVSCPTFGRQVVLQHISNCGLCILALCEVQIFVCTRGFRGRNCTIECIPGTYGVNCLSQCGHCSFPTDCDSVTGVCQRGCQPGWINNTCTEKCAHGTFGINCSSRCGHCLGGPSCDHVKGTCDSGQCQAGYMGGDCNTECPRGWYGENCSNTCAHCNGGQQACKHVTGACYAGCETGWTLDNCTVAVQDDEVPTLAVVVAVPVVVGVLVVSALIVVVVVVIRRKQQRYPENSAPVDIIPEVSQPANNQSVEGSSNSGNLYSPLDPQTRTDITPNTYEMIDPHDQSLYHEKTENVNQLYENL